MIAIVQKSARPEWPKSPIGMGSGVRYDVDMRAVVGRSRVGWIRFLVIVLALTASRGNFPLVKKSESSDKHGLSKAVPKYKGVVPSRRQVESQRSVWQQARTSEPGLPNSPKLALMGQESSLNLAGMRSDNDAERASSSTRPKYLMSHLRAALTSSLPPPV